MKKMLDREGCRAFTSTFQDLYGMEQPAGLAGPSDGPGLRLRRRGRLEGIAMTAILKAMGESSFNGASEFHGGLYLSSGGGGRSTPRRTHAGGLPISGGGQTPDQGTHHLGIGMNEKDPARLVFEGKAGKGIVVSLIDMGGRLRLIVQDIEAVKPILPMPNLPVARASCGVRCRSHHRRGAGSPPAVLPPYGTFHRRDR